MISIITAAYNCEKYLGQAIDSVIAQTFQDWEMLIVDDVSTDRTTEIAQKYAKNDPRIRLICSHQKLYSAGARNLGTQHAAGSYIAFLDADDCWLPQKLEIQYEFMQKNNHALSVTSYQTFNHEGQIHPHILKVKPIIKYHDFFYSNPIGCLTVMYDRNKVGDLFFPTDLFLQEDYVLWAKTLQQTKYHFYGIDIPLAFYRLHPHNKSWNKWRVAQYHWKTVYQRCFNWNFLQKLYYFTFYITINLRKYYFLRPLK